MAVRCADCTRRQHLKREASETRFAQTADASLSVSGTGDASPSNGISLQRQLHKQRQRHAACTGTLRYDCCAVYSGRTDEKGGAEVTATATATVAARNVKGNGNSRCAELKTTATVAARS